MNGLFSGCVVTFYDKIFIEMKNFGVQSIWWLWLFILVLVFPITLLTLDVLPHLQQDEAQITDYGRLALNPNSDWSVTWLISEEKPLLLWTYLGPLTAEISSHFTGSSGLGPRVSSIIGGLVAASMLLGWLLARGVPGFASFWLSTAFLLDPLFVLSQRMARVDCWVFALCIAACWILASESKSQNRSFPRIKLMTAGGLAAGAAFVWPSAIFLYPLIGLELFRLTKAEETIYKKFRSLALASLNFLIGSVFVGFFLILPVWESLPSFFGDINTMVSQNVGTAKPTHNKLLVLLEYQPWLKMSKAFIKTFSPLIPVLGLAGALLHREKGLIFVTVVTVTVIFASLVYEFRVLYLLPYFILLFSGIFLKEEQISTSRLLRKASRVAMTVLVIWSIGISLIVRTALGLEASSEMDRDRIKHVLSTAIGPGEYKVFLDFTYEFYFVGRSLGWEMYTPYLQFTYDEQGNWLRESDHLPKDKFLELLAMMDYAVFYQGAVNKELEDQLTSSGLYFSTNWEIGDSAIKEAVSSTKSTVNVLRWFLQGKQSYGSYVLYARKSQL